MSETEKPRVGQIAIWAGSYGMNHAEEVQVVKPKVFYYGKTYQGGDRRHPISDTLAFVDTFEEASRRLADADKARQSFSGQIGDLEGKLKAAKAKRADAVLAALRGER